MQYKTSYYMKFTNFLWKSALLQKLSAKNTPPPPVSSGLSYLKSGVDYSWLYTMILLRNNLHRF